WRASPRLRRRVAAAVASATLVLAFGVVAAATTGLGWSPTLLLGVATGAAVIGWGIGAIGTLGERRDAPSPA
ncbi:MAG TPA: hypothetical protein VFY43_08100, partial [Candidatus Limnocylindria bacterium]|nr:hypothetical protein [Candidatus Limnocylindria bacterium]